MSAVLNSIYNTYLTTYTPKSVSRHDTHKKSELRGVYNSIVKLNKETPWYLPTTDKGSQAYAVSLKENARILHNTLAELDGQTEEGLINRKNAYSSDEDLVEVAYIGTEDAAQASPSFDIEITHLAESQENMGKFLRSNDPVELPEGSYSFDISIGDMNYEFQFAISEDDTNKAIQSRLARLISNANVGLSADVIESDGRSALVLTSDSTGMPSGDRSLIFSVSDDHTSKTGGTVDYLGLDYVSRAPSNAQFLINGEEREAGMNRFTVGKMFELELKGVSEAGQSVTIGLKTDTESVKDNIRGLISGYNSFLQAAASFNETQSRSHILVGEMRGIAAQFGNSLDSIGITMAEDGSLELDEETLAATADSSEDLHSTFRSIKELSGALTRKTDQISLNPMNYVQRTVVAYKNPGHNFASPYTSSTYSGMMFNYYC